MAPALARAAPSEEREGYQLVHRQFLYPGSLGEQYHRLRFPR
jgi:hypothetical protein